MIPGATRIAQIQYDGQPAVNPYKRGAPQWDMTCDRCGAVFTSPRGRTAYSLRWLLIRSAREAGWKTDGGRDLCPDCRRKGVFA